MKKPARPTLAALLTLPFLLAAGHVFQTNGTSLQQLFPGPFADADFREVVAGEFTGDLQLDAIVRNGATLELAVAPEVFQAKIETGTYPTGFAALPGVVAGKDLLLVADDLGLHLLELDAQSEDWVVTRLFDEESDWAGAIQLAVGDLDGLDGLDVVALGAAGNQVLRAFGAGDGTFVEGTPLTTFGLTCYALRLLDWRAEGDIPGTDEIALASPSGVGVLEADGTYLEGILIPAPNLGLAVIADSGTQLERLVLKAKVNGIDLLRLYGDLQSTTFFPIGPAGVVSMSTGDADGDGDTELFLSVNSERKFWVLENQSPAQPTFDTTNVQEYAYGSPLRDPTWSLAGLAVADFDSDGDADVLAPAQGGDLPQGGGAAIPIRGTLPLVRLGSSDPGAWRAGIDGVTFNIETKVLNVLLTEPQSEIAPTVGTQTKLLVKVWHTADFGQATAPTAFDTQLIDYPDPVALYSVQLPASYSPQTSPDVYSFVVRQVRVDGTGTVVTQAPALSALFVSEANASLVAAADETTAFIPSSIIGDSSGTLGGIGIGPTVPEVPENELPK